MKDACTGDIQEQDWEPLNRGDCFETVKTVLAALAIFCLLTGCGMMNHGDAESESPSPLEGPTATEGFTPAADSTWGDLFRHFDPEGFSKLPADVQSEFDRTLLTEQSPQLVLKEGGKWTFEWQPFRNN